MESLKRAGIDAKMDVVAGVADATACRAFLSEMNSFTEKYPFFR